MSSLNVDKSIYRNGLDKSKKMFSFFALLMLKKVCPKINSFITVIQFSINLKYRNKYMYQGPNNLFFKSIYFRYIIYIKKIFFRFQVHTFCFSHFTLLFYVDGKLIENCITSLPYLVQCTKKLYVYSIKITF